MLDKHVSNAEYVFQTSVSSVFACIDELNDHFGEKRDAPTVLTLEKIRERARKTPRGKKVGSKTQTASQTTGPRTGPHRTQGCITNRFSAGVPWKPHHATFPHHRLSNRTGGVTASGSRKRHTMLRVTPSATSALHTRHSPPGKRSAAEEVAEGTSAFLSPKSGRVREARQDERGSSWLAWSQHCRSVDPKSQIRLTHEFRDSGSVHLLRQSALRLGFFQFEK